MANIVVRQDMKDTFTTGIVTFKQAEDVSNVLSVKKHRLLNKSVNVLAVAAVPVPRIEIEKVNEIPSLECLNDDCLIEIFKMLPLTDLSSISGTCTRFKSIALTVLASSRETIDLSSIEEQNGLKNTSEILVHIGSAMKDMRLKNLNKWRKKKEWNSILNLITRNCSGPLKSLALEDFDLRTYPNMRTLFINLETLNLRDCTLDSSISAILFTAQ